MPTEAPDGLEIRWALPSDCAALAVLERQVKLHYGEEPPAIGVIEATVAEWLEEKPGHALFVIALADGAPAGFASVAVTPPAMGLCAALYMKELFVSAEMRSRGIGRKPLAFLAGFCLAENIERIDLTTAIDNDSGIRFYEREGATVQHQKIALRFDRASLEKLASDENV